MSNSLVRTFSSPDEHRDFARGILDLISVGALTFGRETLEPGWRMVNGCQADRRHRSL
jgi:hypothetical protein